MADAPVTFNYGTWLQRYPEFKGVDQALATLYFNEASLYCVNSISNPAFPNGTLPALLNMLTAHIAWLNSPRDVNGNPASGGSQPPSPLVGRISQATEGSVSVSAESDYPPGTPQWYQQSRYGSAYWAATAPYRTARYAARPTMVAGMAYPYFPYGGRIR